MDDIEDFFNIGKNFIKPRNCDPIKELTDELDKKAEEVSKPTGLSHDGRPRDEFSIVFNPDPNYINPDMTGNGVACMEGLDLKYYGDDVEENAVLAKSELNNFANILLEIKSYLVKVSNVIDISPYKIMALRTIFENLCAAKSSITPMFDLNNFDSDKFYEYFSNYFDVVNKIDFNWKNSTSSKGYSLILDELYLNKDSRDLQHILLYFGAKKCGKNVLLRNVINFDKYNQFIQTVNMCASRIAYIDFNRNISKIVVDFKKRMKTMNTQEATIAKTFVDSIYSYGVQMCRGVIDFCKYIMDIYNIISPSKNSSSLFGTNTNSFIHDIDKKNPWVSADYHLLKDLIKGDESMAMTEKIIATHNKYVKPNDLFLFLGDISESELYDQANKKYLGKLIELCKRLNGIKIMIIGNNDSAPTKFYKECGFIEVYENPVLTSKYVFSHGPVYVDKGIINVHGHIHGSKSYWGVDHNDHVDAYLGLYGQPVKLNDLTSYQNMSKYQQGCVSKFGPKYSKDPELNKPITLS